MDEQPAPTDHEDDVSHNPSTQPATTTTAASSSSNPAPAPQTESSTPQSATTRSLAKEVLAAKRAGRNHRPRDRFIIGVNVNVLDNRTNSVAPSNTATPPHTAASSNNTTPSNVATSSNTTIPSNVAASSNITTPSSVAASSNTATSSNAAESSNTAGTARRGAEEDYDRDSSDDDEVALEVRVARLERGIRENMAAQSSSKRRKDRKRPTTKDEKKKMVPLDSRLALVSRISLGD